MELPINEIKGSKIKVKIRVKGEKVAPPLHSWNGVKVMVHGRINGDDFWPQLNLPTGTFDWTSQSFIAFIPPATDAAWLVLGLEESKGKVQFDDVEVTVIEANREASSKKIEARRPTAETAERLRGTMISTLATENDLKTLAGWGANHIRWQLTWSGFPLSPADTSDLTQYRIWLESTLAHVDSLLPLCRNLKLKVLLDLHTLPGGMRKSGYGLNLFTDKKWQDAFEDIWTMIANRYKNEPAVWGYDLANEPIEYNLPDDVRSWHELATAVATKIRKIDPNRIIVYEGAPGAAPSSFSCLRPLPVPGVVYSFHMYEPGAFTHQGVYSPTTNSYPGIINGVEWDKEKLRDAMKPVYDFQREFNVPIYVGEFSAVRWAPDDNAYNYLRDCIYLFEEAGWDWAYHAFREADVWSVEHGPDRDNHMPSDTTTSREKLLKEAFRQNKR